MYNKLRKEELLPYGIIIIEKHKQYRFCSNVFLNLLEYYSGKDFSYDGTKKSRADYLNNLKGLNSDQKNYLLYFLKMGSAHYDSASNIFWKASIGLESESKQM